MSGLLLADGRFFKGDSFGHIGEIDGEVVFNTSMTGYQEILSDPSYYAQIMVLTFPEIGVYGIDEDCSESVLHGPCGVIVRRLSGRGSASLTLHEYCQKRLIVGLSGIDTRALTLHIRNQGSMMGRLIHGGLPNDVERKKVLLAMPSITSRLKDAVKHVSSQTVEEPHSGQRSGEKAVSAKLEKDSTGTDRALVIAVVDCGAKGSILKMLAHYGARVQLYAPDVSHETLLNADVHGVVYSNGPGDPQDVPEAMYKEIRALIGKLPLFGVCLGHQLFAHALHGKTFKLLYGHHGANHPIQDLQSGRIFVTAQNHNFCVDPESFDPEEVAVTHVNLNDNTCAGLKNCKSAAPMSSLQFHPEGGPGPHDTWDVFAEFLKTVRKYWSYASTN